MDGRGWRLLSTGLLKIGKVSGRMASEAGVSGGGGSVGSVGGVGIGSGSGGDSGGGGYTRLCLPGKSKTGFKRS